MNVEKVFKSKHKNEIKQLYEAAFPKTERMPFPLMLIMSCLWHTEFLAYYWTLISRSYGMANRT